MKPFYLNFLRTALLVLCAIGIYNSQAQVIQTFKPVYQNSQKGGIVFLSNVALTCNTPDTVASPPSTGTSNNSLPSVYVDRDNDPTTFMSSSDSLALPPCSEISFAGIYWGGYATNVTTGFATRDQIKIKANANSYINLTADSSSTYAGASFITYHCYKDITSIIKSYGINARWTVADVIGQTGVNNRFAGWNIIIVYKNDLQNMRQLTVFNGLANINSGTVDIPVTGFLTPPTGPVTFEMGVFCYDGDRPTTGDQLLFNGNGSYVNISDGINGVNNVFNSTIGNNGALTPYRIPNFSNNFSIDADIFVPNNAAKNYIGNSATSCILRQTTSGDVYLTQAVTFAIDVYSPDDRAAVRVNDLNGGTVMPGDILQYTVVGKNIGSDPSLYTFVSDSLEGNIEYIPNTLNITYGPNAGPMTDAAGDDQAEYDAASRSIIVRIGTGANSTTGGQVLNSVFGTDSTQFTYQVQVISDCYKLACDNIINNSAVITGTGVTSGLTYTNASNPDIFDGFGCPVPGSTNTAINTGTCSLPADTTITACSNLTFATLYPHPGYLFYNSSFVAVLAPAGTGTYYAIYTSYAGCADTVTITVASYLNCNPPVTFNETLTTAEDTPVNGNVLSNGDNDPDGTALTANTTPVSGPSNGSITLLLADGSFTYTPDPDFSGTDQFIISLCDNGLPAPVCTNDTIFVTITPVNDPPVANNDVTSTNEDTPITFNITSNDTDVDGTIDPATIDLDPATPGIQTSFTVPGQGAFVADPVTGNVTFTPVLNFNGIVTPVTYSVCDNGTPLPALCAQANLVLTVTAVNDPPVAAADPNFTDQNTPVTFNVTSNDTDIDGAIDPASIDLDPASPGIQTTFTVPGEGTYVANPATGDVTFTPALNYVGIATPVTYSICDNGTPLPAQCAQAQISMVVNSVNAAPAVTGTTDVTAEDTPKTICLTISDPDAGSSFTASTFSAPANGTVGSITVIGNQVCVTYTPNLNYNGTDLFTIQVCDNGTPTLCDTAIISVNVTPVNDPPVAGPDFNTTSEETPVTFNISSNDTDIDGTIDLATLDLDPLTAGIQTTFTVAGEGTYVLNPATGDVTFTPVLNFNGTATPVTYQICDNGTPIPSQCSQTTINVTVTPVNDAPVANPDVQTTNEDTPVTIAILTNDTDLDGTMDPASVDLDIATPGIQTSFTVAGEGTYVVNPATGIVTYTPAANFNGVATPVTYSACDNGTPLPALCAQSTITITVTPVNDPPVVVMDPQTTSEDTPVSFNILTNDSDIDGAIDPSSIDLDPATPGLQTTFTVSGEGVYVADPLTGIVTFTPDPNFNGVATPVTYSVCDNGSPLPAQCAQSTINVTVTPVNDPPVAVADPQTTNEDTPVSFNILTNDSDIDGTLDPASIDLDPATPGIQTTFTVIGEGVYVADPLTGIVTFTPAPDFNGIATPVTYSVCDNGTPLPALCALSTINITVTPINDPPVVVMDSQSTAEDTPVTVNVISNDSDIDGSIDPATVDLDVATPGIQNTFTVAGEGTYVADPVTGIVTYTPALNFNGIATPVTYSVCDNGTPLPVQCAQTTINITVTPVNDPPVAVADTANTNEDSPVSFNILTNDTDIDGTIDPASIDLDPLTPGLQTTFTVAGEGSYVADPLTGNVIFTPDPDYNGTTTAVTYSVCDNGTPLPAQCSQSTITVIVFPVNDPPSITGTDVTTPEDMPINICLTISDVDAGSVFTASSCGDPTNGTFGTPVITGNQVCMTYTPNPEFSGNDQFCIQICDDGFPPLCDTAIINVTVTPVNDPPVVVNDTATTMENTAVTFNILTNDTDVDGTIDPATIDLDPASPGIQTSFSVIGEGTYVVDPATGDVTFTPEADFNGITTPVNYSVCDNGSPLPAECSQATITVIVMPVNDPPVITGTTVTTSEDELVVVCMTISDPDAGSTFTASLCGDPANGTLSAPIVTGNQVCVSYTPSPDFNGTNQFCIQICDNGTPALCDTAIITINVTSVNDKPVVVNESASICSSSVATGNVFNGDLDPEGTTLDVSTTPVLEPLHGTFTIASTGDYTYTPDNNFSGTDIMIVSICDNGIPLPNECTNDTITILVSPQLLLNAGPDDKICEGQLYPLTSAVAENFSSIIWLTSGTGYFNNPTTAHPTYVPSAGDAETGSVTLTVTAISTAICNETLVDSITITIVPAPKANAGSDGSICEGTTFKVSDATISSAGLIEWTHNGLGALNGANSLAPTYEPGFNESGTVILTMTVHGNTVCATTAVSDQMTLKINHAVVANAGADQTIVTGATTTLNGSAEVFPNQYIFYSWQPDTLLVNSTIMNPVTIPLTSTATFTLTATDVLSGCSDSDDVTITVGPDSNAPVPMPDYDTTLTDTPVTINVLANDLNSGGKPLTVSICGGAQHGIMVVNSDNTITYTPYRDYLGNDSFCYRICDNSQPEKCSDTTVYIFVKPPSMNDLTFYNGISPNGDGHNDVWLIKGIENYPDNTVRIFNRWGDKIRDFEEYNNTDRAWDGTNDENKKVPDGTYFYVLEIKNVGSRAGWIFIRGNK